MKNDDIEKLDSVNTTFGRSKVVSDSLAHKRFLNLLKKSNTIATLVFYPLLFLFVVLTIAATRTINFENTIFSDGTSLSCLYDGSKEEVINVK